LSLKEGKNKPPAPPCGRPKNEAHIGLVAQGLQVGVAEFPLAVAEKQHIEIAWPWPHFHRALEINRGG
jgi:hypothetical protein